MALWCLFLLGLVMPIYSQVSQCAWEDFNLIQAQGYEIQCVDGGGTFAVGYTPCMSYALCSGSRYQAVFFDRFSGVCQYYLAAWDDGETAPKFRYNRDGDDKYTWTFEYRNGQTCENGDERLFEVVWKCNEQAIPFSTATVCSYDSDTNCYNEMIIESSAACVEGVEESSGSSSSSSGGTSTGSLILILAMVAFILYCLIGYGISWHRSEERDWKQVKEHTPCWEFWTYGLCAYTKAGCCVTFEWLNSKMGKGGEGGTDTDYTMEDDVYE
eukprot:CAMPEP_0201578604 /NCGR_PEP_ID=MMETSP0190_2-20130828/25558_1 /ASSEMBLY_ACC=CAM_ASM_000263 /TAXON_ID=37353 /ORGANISM="Rosalina sp." /LENGTH=269 /DNA_ID=CAMNT_0048011969 /DNA_START=995 /DNA_END=1804 /DNA_ORIENTATION=-